MDRQKLRHTVQALWAAASNSYIIGFFKGKIYSGKLKALCVPGLNCYSCPAALGSCPIGSLQAVLGSKNFKAAYYVCGFLMIVGALTGRLVCGFLCPFGLIQELLHKIPFFKKIKTFKGDMILRKFKYVILAVFVILLPLFAVDISGEGSPYFCKFICPVGALEGGIPLVIINKALRSAVGFLYTWKLLILSATLIASIIIYRPFCKYICPLGAIYSLFNKVSLYRMEADNSKCVSCGKCKNECPMNIDPKINCNHTECIRCGKCIDACPTNALSCKLLNNTNKNKNLTEENNAAGTDT